MSARIFNGDTRIDAWPPDARAPAYGDGVFETMRVHRGAVAWWDAHWERLVRGAHRLHLSLPAEAQVRAEAAALFDEAADGVLKLLLSRGGAGRGYTPRTDAPPIWMLSRHPLPQITSRPGLTVRWVTTQLAVQPALAGIKHCNRLEQVLACEELAQTDADEGLMQDGDGAVVSATAANLFAYRDGRWHTPLVDRCGVAGVCRAHLLALLDAVQARLSVADVEGAQAVFLCNAVRGILPVARIGGQSRPPHPAVDDAMCKLARIHPAFVVDHASTTGCP